MWGGIGVMHLPEFVNQQREAVGALCERLHVRRLDLFGSAVRPDFDAKRSDLDFVVAFDELPPVEYADAFCKDIPDGTREVGICEVECISGARSLSWAYEGFVCGWPAGEVRTQHKCFTVTAAGTFPDKANSTHARFIDDQEVSRFQEVCDLVKDDVGVGATARVDMQKPRGVARLKRCLRDAVIREDVIKRI